MRGPGSRIPARFNGSVAETRTTSDERSRRRTAAQLINGLRERELLAGETGDEASTACGAARLHAAQRPDDIAPGQCDRLARDDVAKHHAPAHQQLLGDRLGERIVLGNR